MKDIFSLIKKPGVDWTEGEFYAAKEFLAVTPEVVWTDRHADLLFVLGEAEDARIWALN